MADKFDFQKIINEVKSMISPPPIPEANKDDPVAYYLSELSKLAKNLADQHTNQADTIAKISTMIGNLYQEITKKGGKSSPSITPSVGKSESKVEPKPQDEPK